MTYVFLCPGIDPLSMLVVLAVIVAGQVAAGAAVGIMIARVISAVKRSGPVRLR